jgi:uncharacterized protein
MLAPANTNFSTSGKLAENIMHFARVLRDAGIPLGPGAVHDALDATVAGVLRKREDFYWTLHAVFIKRREHRELFDQAFHLFWKKPKIMQQLTQIFVDQAANLSQHKKRSAGARRLSEAMFALPKQSKAPKSRHEEWEIEANFTASADDVLRTKDFEQMTVSEQRQATQALRRLRLNRIEVATRRFRPAHAGERIDMRATLRRSIRAGGHLLDLRHKTRLHREPPLVILCDISGSCSNYTRMFLHFLHTLMSDRDRVHVFLFGTRLTNITRELRRKDIDEALLKVSAAVKDWSGGTRIASTLHDFNFKWARRVLGQGAHLLLMTDGLERDNIAALEVEMMRLRRSARRIVWLNPLLRFDGFEAKAAGIRAIMPHVDEFRPVHSLESLADLAATLAEPRGNAHDPKQWMKDSERYGD